MPHLRTRRHVVEKSRYGLATPVRSHIPRSPTVRAPLRSIFYYWILYFSSDTRGDTVIILSYDIIIHYKNKHIGDYEYRRDGTALNVDLLRGTEDHPGLHPDSVGMRTAADGQLYLSGVSHDLVGTMCSMYGRKPYRVQARRYTIHTMCPVLAGDSPLTQTHLCTLSTE